MNTLDLLIIVIVLALGAIGYAQGFIVGAASLSGLVLGGIIGTRVATALVERAVDGPGAAAWAPVAGLIIGLVIALVGAMAMQDVGARLRHEVRRREGGTLDHLMGAVLLALVGLLLAWFAATVALGIPPLRPMRAQIFTSTVISKLNRYLPDAQTMLGDLAALDRLPQFKGGEIETAAPDPRLPRDPQVRDASRSVVRVVGSACGYRITGTAWVMAPGFLATNAHVVAGQTDTAIQPRGVGDLVDADVVAFDPVNDLAILRVEDLGMAPLTQRAQTGAGTAAVLLGYPENQGFAATAARYSDERTVRGEDIYGDGAHEREITGFRGLVRHGNSGGPLVDGDGKVISTVFASTVGDDARGGYGIPNELVVEALARAREVPSDKVVRTGRCVP